MTSEASRTIKDDKRVTKTPKDVGAVVNAVRILACLAASTKPLGVAAVARSTGVSTSTCFNILRTLARTRYVSFSSANKTYALGLAVAELASGLIGTSPAELILPEMERLAVKHEMLMLLWRVTEDGHVVLIARAHSHTVIRAEISVGFRMPALAGAVGRCMAAAMKLSDPELRRRFSGLRWEMAPSFERYREQVREARERGWSIDDNSLYRGIISIGAVIEDRTGSPRFGLSGVCIAGRRKARAFRDAGEDLRALAEVVSRSLYPERKDETEQFGRAAE